MKKLTSWQRTVAMSALVLAASIGVVPASAQGMAEDGGTNTSATQENHTTGHLDPETFAGPVLVATPEGEVLTTVRAGELPTKAAEIREDVAEGRITADPQAEMKAMAAGTCGNWQRAVGSPFGYANSTAGCAVMGYPNFWRGYEWSNWSDVQGCVQGKGWSAANTSQVIWMPLGCGNSGSANVHWGNVLATTQVRGQSLSGLTGFAYNWWD